MEIIKPLFQSRNAACQRCSGAVCAAHGLNIFRFFLGSVRIHIYVANALHHACIQHFDKIINHFIVIHNKTSSSISLAWEEPACNANRPPLPIIMAYAIIICLNPFLNRLQIPDLLYQEHQE